MADRARDRIHFEWPTRHETSSRPALPTHGPLTRPARRSQDPPARPRWQTYETPLCPASGANAAITPHPKGHNMGPFKTFRIRIGVERAKRMRPATCSTNSSAPQPRAESSNATPLLSGDLAGTRHAPASSLDIQSKDFRPAEPQCSQHLAVTEINERLDTIRTKRVDENPQSMNLTTVYGSDSANDSRYQSGWNPERTPDPCPPHPRTAPDSAPPGGQQPAGRVTRRRLPGSTNTLGRR